MCYAACPLPRSETAERRNGEINISPVSSPLPRSAALLRDDRQAALHCTYVYLALGA